MRAARRTVGTSGVHAEQRPPHPEHPSGSGGPPTRHARLTLRSLMLMDEGARPRPTAPLNVLMPYVLLPGMSPPARKYCPEPSAAMALGISAPLKPCKATEMRAVRASAAEAVSGVGLNAF